jgi:molecular chaperone HscB
VYARDFVPYKHNCIPIDSPDVPRHASTCSASCSSSQKERQFSADQSSWLNRGYRTLIDPIARTEHLLQLRGVNCDDEDNSGIIQDEDFLNEMMELNEEVVDTVIVTGPGHDSFQELADLDQLRERVSQRISVLMTELSNCLSTDRLNDARDVLRKLRYFDRIKTNINRRLGLA